MSNIVYKDGSIKKVKNLGWLLHNWQKVECFCFNYRPISLQDGQLIAHLKNDDKYVTDFASLSVCFRFLNRPVFKGLRFEINNLNLLTQSGFIIGSPEYNEINRLEYKEQMSRLV